ncbi:Glycosyltransferase [Melia azedarach]|uniref:Glycosyltransferase n=1 Tax=Melia azedarach TaxID=155640 RepID=A0ACC1YY94_MELAZ|nr:Glycosyltransferase [Melia azedarach]
MDQEPHIVIVPSPGMGHLIPLVEFAKELVLHHEFSVTIIISTTGSILLKSQKSVLEILPQGINRVFLPPVSFDDLPEDTRIQTKLTLTVTRSLPFLRDAIRSLVATTRLLALVTDHFGTDSFDVANEFNVPPYLFFTSSPLNLSFMLFDLPKMDKSVSCEYRDMPEPVVNIPGFSTLVHVSDLPDPVQDRKNDAYKWLLHNAKRFVLADGIILNSFGELAPGLIKVLQEEVTGKRPVYPIGPIIRTGSSHGSDGSDCLKWLDNQPSKSVLFISFGSGGTLSYDQLTELALGLEISEQKFLWVVKSPDEKTKGQGLVVPSWAPQIEILSHDSTGGFSTHCGWNSTVESVVHGVPMIAWPLFAEQKLNAVMLSEDIKVAVRPKSNENGLVRREEIARVVKSLIQGEEGLRIRERMDRLRNAAANALREEGSSTKSRLELLLKWKNHERIYQN